ncbi:flavodoxin [Burkholderia sp. JPY481]
MVQPGATVDADQARGCRTPVDVGQSLPAELNYSDTTARKSNLDRSGIASRAGTFAAHDAQLADEVPHVRCRRKHMSERCRILIVYYSRTGTTRRDAELLASGLDADIEPIREPGGPEPRNGARGFVRSLMDALCHRHAEVMPALLDVAAYDLVVVGAPVWARGACAPARAWLELHGPQVRRLALFCCEGAFGGKEALKQMSEAAGKVPLATCVFTGSDLYRRKDGVKRDTFAQKIRSRMAARREMEWLV